MKKTKLVIIITALSLSVIAGAVTGFITNKPPLDHGYAHTSLESGTSLEEQFHNVDLIIRGTVLSQEETFQQNSGIATKYDGSFPVTPAIIQVDEVLYGNTDNKTITYLQHGFSEDKVASRGMVKQAEEVLLILSRTINETYWSYNFDDGVWRILRLLKIRKNR